MKKSLFTLFILLVTSAGFAHDNPDQRATCYIFNNNQLQSKSACIVQSGGGAGGSYTSLKIRNKNYLFETSQMTDDYKTYYYPNENSEGKLVIEYTRDPSTLKTLTPAQSANRTKLLYCYKTRDNKLNICHS